MTMRKSSAVKELRGTLRRDRMPKPERGARLTKPPRPPAHLSEGACVQWRRLAPAAVALGTLTTTDLATLGLLAETLATAEAARAIVEAEGFSVATADGGAKAHPAVRIMETARGQARPLLEAFGLTPRARQALDVIRAEPADNSPWRDLMVKR